MDLSCLANRMRKESWLAQACRDMIKTSLPEVYVSEDRPLGHLDQIKERGKDCWKSTLGILGEE